jgi:hypothetical protein
VDPAVFSSLLATYLHAVAAGDNLLRITTIGPAALRGYMTSACDALTLLTHKPCSYIDPATLEFKRPKTLPILGDIIGQRTAWKEPRPRKEPFTLAMIDALRDYLHGQTKQYTIQHVFLTAVYAAYDWLRLGTFSGSRISEYAQTRTTKDPITGKRYACVPNSPAAGPWANQPIAFIETDFVFYSKEAILVANKFCLLNTALDHIWEFHLRFRFDKSKNNFTIRKYTRLPGMNFDPVIAAINIIRRAYLLGILPDEPLGQYRALGSSTNSLLRDSDIRDNLRLGCRLAYPNPNHYCRIHILGLVPHSTRVTAALCLKLGGATDEEIAFRLRWHIASVPTYLRECYCGIDQLMQTAISGVYRTG